MQYAKAMCALKINNDFYISSLANLNKNCIKFKLHNIKSGIITIYPWTEKNQAGLNMIFFSIG